jgi:hypothetical protein
LDPFLTLLIFLEQQDGPEPENNDGSPFHFSPAAPVVLFCKDASPLTKVLMQSQPDSSKSASKRRQFPEAVAHPSPNQGEKDDYQEDPTRDMSSFFRSVSFKYTPASSSLRVHPSYWYISAHCTLFLHRSLLMKLLLRKNKCIKKTRAW